MHRIQKLLHRDFKSIPDVILLESAFAETNKKGKGLRQVYLALSAHNLFIAVDEVGKVCNDVSGGRLKNYDNELVDPVIETLELTSMFPLDCVCLHIYKERTRNTIKLYTAQNPDRARYFELGGCGYLGNRAKLWTLWQDKIKHLNSTGFENTLSIHSETSVGTSVSKSTAYPVYLDMLRRSRGCEVGSTWREEIVCDNGHVHVVDAVSVRQMGMDFYRLVEDSVFLWETASNNKPIGSARKKCLPYPRFCYGFGTIRVRKQEKHLLFVRKTKSLLTLDRNNCQELEFQLSFSKKNLTGTISQLSLTHPLRGCTPHSPLFWTTQCSRYLSPHKNYLEALRLRNEWKSDTPSFREEV
ncbi:hypothetical protein WDU94_013568 [Cyamophila willieti]